MDYKFNCSWAPCNKIPSRHASTCRLNGWASQKGYIRLSLDHFILQCYVIISVSLRLATYIYSCLFQDIRGSESVCKVILNKVGLEGWRLGTSRVFLRYFHEEKLLLLLKDMEDKAILIQKIFRGWSTRKRYNRGWERVTGQTTKDIRKSCGAMNLQSSSCLLQ